MTTLNNREKALEAKHFNDEELKFKAISRRRKLLGLWAAEYMRHDDNIALEYALELVNFGIENKEDGAVVNKVMKDIKNAGLDITENEIRLKMQELHRQAVKELEEQFQAGTN